MLPKIRRNKRIVSLVWVVVVVERTYGRGCVEAWLLPIVVEMLLAAWFGVCCHAFVVKRMHSRNLAGLSWTDEIIGGTGARVRR